MFKNSFTSRLRSRTGSFLLASSVAIASVTVAGLTASPANATPVSYGTVISNRTVASDGTFTWQRKTGKRIYVYFQHASIRSNTVNIAPR